VLEGEAERLQETMVALESDKEVLSEDRAQLERQLGETRSRLQELSQEVTTREERLEGLRQTHQAMVEELKEQIQQKQVQISSLEEKLSIRFLDRILFDPGNARIRPKGREVLKDVAEGLKKLSGTMIHVEGHTDSLPLSQAARTVYVDNLGLSVARAAAVVRTLRTMGVDRELLSAAGYSMDRPLASNATDEGRQQNRRVEIILSPMH